MFMPTAGAMTGALSLLSWSDRRRFRRGEKETAPSRKAGRRVDTKAESDTEPNEGIPKPSHRVNSRDGCAQ